MKEIIKNTAILTAITLVAGLLLSGVYQITKEPIAEQEALRQAEACESVFSEAASFDTEIEVANDGIVEGYENDVIDQVAAALDEDGEVLGYVITVTSSEGYGGDIQFTLGIKNGGTLSGLEILSISETAGLGMKAKEDDFKNQFKKMTVAEDGLVTFSKTGATGDTEIDAISGATITTTAMTNGVNACLAYYYAELAEEGE